MSNPVTRAVARGIARSVRSVRVAASICQLVEGGVVRKTGASLAAAARQEAAAQSCASSFVLKKFRERQEASLDEAFAELRWWRTLEASLDDLKNSGALKPRVRTQQIKWGVGQVLHHQLRGRCVVYGWERESLHLTEALQPDLDAILVDNRKSFVGIDPGLVSSREPHYRVLFHDGVARICRGDVLARAGPSTDDDQLIRGSSFFFRGIDRRAKCLIPRLPLQALYPDDAAFILTAPQHATTGFTLCDSTVHGANSVTQ